MFPWKDNLSIYIFFIHEFQYPVNLNIIHEKRTIESRGTMMVNVTLFPYCCWRCPPVWSVAVVVVVWCSGRGWWSAELPVSQSGTEDPALPARAPDSPPAPVTVRPPVSQGLSGVPVWCCGGNKSWYLGGNGEC